MKYLLFLLLAIPTFCFCQERQEFMAGMAQVNVTPDVPIRMSGYGNRTKPFTGVHDSIYATSLVMSLNGNRVAIIGADVVGFSHRFVDDVKSRIESTTGIPTSHVMVVAAHNHGGPVTSVYSDDPTPEEETYFETLKQKLVNVVQEAESNRFPAKIGAGKGVCMMNVNRRARHARGGIWLGRNPAGPCDREVGMLRVDHIDGRAIGAFLNWPCHATVSGQENTQITGDWPGAAAQTFTSLTGSLLLVTAGASADINAIYGPNHKFDDITSIGLVLGEEAARVFTAIETTRPHSMKMIEATFIAEGKSRSESRMPNVSLEVGDPQTIRMSGLRIGSTSLVGISGELMTEIGMEIKDNSPYKNTFIVTHCNGSNGYLCTDTSYQEGGYEPMVSKTMPGTADKITRQATILLDRL